MLQSRRKNSNIRHIPVMTACAYDNKIGNLEEDLTQQSTSGHALSSETMSEVKSRERWFRQHWEIQKNDIKIKRGKRLVGT